MADSAKAHDERPPMPLWGQKARRLAKAVWPVFMGMWFIGLLAQLVGWILGADGDDLQRTFRDSMPWALIGWPFAIGYAVALVLVAIGAVGWLAGSFAAGFNEPREK